MYVTEVVAEHVDLLDSKNDNQQGQSNGYNQQPQQINFARQESPVGNFNPMNISDDDLPF